MPLFMLYKSFIDCTEFYSTLALVRGLMGTIGNYFPFYMTSNYSVLIAVKAPQSLSKWTKFPRSPQERRERSPLFSLLTFPPVRSVSQFKGEVLPGQAGLMLLAGLEAAPPPMATGSSTEGFCWSMVPRVGFSPAKEI